MALLDSIPLYILVLAALTLGLAPFFPEPHLWEKLKMLAAGNLIRPIDILDLLMHGPPRAVARGETCADGAEGLKLDAVTQMAVGGGVAVI